MEKNVLTDGTVVLKILVDPDNPYYTTNWIIAPDSNVKNIDDADAYMSYGYQIRVMLYVEKDGQRFLVGDLGRLNHSNMEDVYFVATQLIITEEHTSSGYKAKLSILSWHADGHFSLDIENTYIPFLNS